MSYEYPELRALNLNEKVIFVADFLCLGLYMTVKSSLSFRLALGIVGEHCTNFVGTFLLVSFPTICTDFVFGSHPKDFEYWKKERVRIKIAVAVLGLIIACLMEDKYFRGINNVSPSGLMENPGDLYAGFLGMAGFYLIYFSKYLFSSRKERR